MAKRRVTILVTSGPNEGDTVRLDAGSCRLIGRHLSENETVMIDRDGNRLLDGDAASILVQHLKDKAPPTGLSSGEGFHINAFERGPDVIFADDSISRAHAMVFHDAQGVGIIDLASTNGTFVNRERIGSTFVSDGDTISVGNSELNVRLR